MSSSASYLSPEQLQLDLSIRDLSDPAEGPHAVQILIDRAVQALSRAWACEVRWCRGPRIVPVVDNYDRLGYAAGAITREARYTRYVNAEQVLRSHSSAMVPSAPPARRGARRRRAPGLPNSRPPGSRISINDALGLPSVAGKVEGQSRVTVVV